MSNLNLRQESVAVQGSRSDHKADIDSRDEQSKEVISRTNEAGISSGPILGMWTPEMGIKFADTKPESEKMTTKKAKDATWNSSKGMKFN